MNKLKRACNFGTAGQRGLLVGGVFFFARRSLAAVHSGVERAQGKEKYGLENSIE